MPTIKLKSTLRAALTALLLGVAPVQAAPLPPAAQGEIAALLSRLAASGCQFKRNGAWHTAGEAQAHLQRKLDYLVARDAVGSAEQFIERAASRSSVTGERYWVKCGSQPPVPSGTWLATQLQGLRAAPAAPASVPR